MYAALGFFWAPCGTAASITNVTAVNVTPTSFSILWRTVSSSPSIAVFADPGGLTNLAGQLGIESFPLHTGNPDAAAGYARRQSLTMIRQKTQSLGQMLMRVSGCQPGTAYYYRLTSTLSPSNSISYPASGPLPGLTTAVENSFVVDDEQLILDVPNTARGSIVTVSNAGAAYLLAAVVGDGVGTNQVFFNLSDLFSMVTGTNFAPLGQQQFFADLLGTNQTDALGQFTLTFTNTFASVHSTEATLNVSNQPPFLNLVLGSTALQMGRTSNVPVSVSSSGFTNLTFVLNLSRGYLTNLSLSGFASGINPFASRITSRGGTNYIVQLAALPGQSISGSQQLAQINFTALTAPHSAFVPLKLSRIAASAAGLGTLTNLSGASGRVVVIGQESLVEALLQTNRERTLLLYGKPYSSYFVQYATSLRPPVAWNNLPPIALTKLTLAVPGVSTNASPVFYRSFEFFAEPPMLAAAFNPDGTGILTLFGRPGFAYLVQSTTNLIDWTTIKRVPLTNSFAFIPVSDRGDVYYRAIDYQPAQPYLDIQHNPDGSADLTLYGQPGAAYLVEYTSNLNPPINWTVLQRIGLTGSFAFIHVDSPVPANFNVVPYNPATPQLDISHNPDGSISLTLYGRPGASYLIQSAATLGSPTVWTNLLRVPLSSAFTTLTEIAVHPGNAFFQAIEFQANPPILQSLLNPDRTRNLLVFGVPSNQYTLQYKTNLLNAAAWSSLTTATLTNSFVYLPIANTNPIIFYRLRKN